jgi:hypothetical protein
MAQNERLSNFSHFQKPIMEVQQKKKWDMVQPVTLISMLLCLAN